jgi:hypothetical protein
MKRGRGGYFRTNDEYSRYQVTDSNEREMVYLNADYISFDIMPSLLAHEFVHLITFNQKDIIQGTEEEIWLNEARADYAPTLLGYDENYQDSYLQKRVIEFLINPSDSLTEWNNSSADYGALNLFTQYLVDHYGVKILADSLHSPKKGIESINFALSKNGFSGDFSQIFTDWTIAALVNDCSLAEKYCFKNSNLKNLKLVPTSNFVDTGKDTVIKFTISNWSGNWQKILGENESLSLEVCGFTSTDFKISYVLCDITNKCEIHPINNESGSLSFDDFENKYIVIVSSLPSSSVLNAQISLKVKSSDETIQEKTEQEFLVQIEYLKREIARLKAQLDAIKNNKNIPNNACGIKNDLFFGLSSNSEVICLQQLLRNQGNDIYPEGLITGNFLELTKRAVIRFQEKYADEILKPLGLTRGTGYVGEMTRKKISEILK